MTAAVTGSHSWRRTITLRVWSLFRESSSILSGECRQA